MQYSQKFSIRLLTLVLGVAALPTMASASVWTATSSPAYPLHKQVALTFDDGPYGSSTEAVLRILAQEQVPATFFLMGQNVARYPILTRAIAQSGAEIGNHTYTHPNLKKLTVSQMLSEVALTEAEIATTTGLHPHLFRAPYGLLSKSERAAMVAAGFQVVPWNADPDDWNDASSTTAQIVARVHAQESPRMVLLLHDGRDTHIGYPRDNMLAALPIIIAHLKSEGYTFETVSSLRPLRK